MGSLLASQTKASMCASSLRPSWDSGEELDTCGRGARIYCEEEPPPLFVPGPQTFCPRPHCVTVFPTSNNRCPTDTQSRLSQCLLRKHLTRIWRTLKSSKALSDAESFAVFWCTLEHGLTICSASCTVGPCAVTSLGNKQAMSLLHRLLIKTTTLIWLCGTFIFPYQEQSASESANQTFHITSISKRWLRLCTHIPRGWRLFHSGALSAFFHFTLAAFCVFLCIECLLL